MSDDARFPVLHQAFNRPAGYPRSIPWAAIAPHERQAQRNHYQTLKRLAERGGLSPCEMVAVLEDREWKKMPDADAIARLRELVPDVR